MDRETILNLFCVNGISFLNSLGDLPEAEQSAAVEALASFHNQGLFEEEGDLRHTMQNIVWSQNSLTEGGASVWRALLSRTGITPSGIGDSYSDLDEAILNSILDHRRNASAHKDDFYAAAYDILDTRRSGNTCTVYLYICFGSYDLTEESYALQTGGEAPAALTFSTINGLYQLTEYWTPLGRCLLRHRPSDRISGGGGGDRHCPHRLGRSHRPAGRRGGGTVCRPAVHCTPSTKASGLYRRGRGIYQSAFNRIGRHYDL